MVDRGDLLARLALGAAGTEVQHLGIVMERYQMDEDRAFQFMVRVSSQSNIKLRDIAQEVVDQMNFRARGEAPPSAAETAPEGQG